MWWERRASATTDIADIISPDKTRFVHFSRRPARSWWDFPRPKRVLGAVGILGLTAFLFACAPTAASTSTAKLAPTIRPTVAAALERFLPTNEPTRNTGAPHNFYRNPDGIRNSLDFTSYPVISCPPGEKQLVDVTVVATVSGTITKVGDMNNPDDPNHSIVEIEAPDGSKDKLTHLDKIPVAEGEHVQGGQTPVGKMSCQKPPKGATTGEHVDYSRWYKNGDPMPWDGQVVAGYTVHAGKRPYDDGTLTRSGQPTRTADARVCGPTPELIKACGGIRNDLNMDASIFNTLAAAARQEAADRPIPPGFRRYTSQASYHSSYRIDFPRDWQYHPINYSAFADAFGPDTPKFEDYLLVVNENLRKEQSLENYASGVISHLSSRGTWGSDGWGEIHPRRLPFGVDGRDVYRAENMVAGTASYDQVAISATDKFSVYIIMSVPVNDMGNRSLADLNQQFDQIVQSFLWLN